LVAPTCPPSPQNSAFLPSITEHRAAVHDKVDILTRSCTIFRVCTIHQADRASLFSFCIARRQSEFAHRQLGLGANVVRAACLRVPRPQTFGCTTSISRTSVVWVCVPESYLITGVPIHKSKLTTQGSLPSSSILLQFDLLHY
jgi:hypothetical protein